MLIPIIYFFVSGSTQTIIIFFRGWYKLNKLEFTQDKLNKQFNVRCGKLILIVTSSAVNGHLSMKFLLGNNCEFLQTILILLKYCLQPRNIQVLFRTVLKQF